MNQAYAYLGESTLDAYNSQGQWQLGTQLLVLGNLG